MTTKQKIFVTSIPAVALLFLAMLPSSLPNRTTDPKIICINNLRYMDGVKQEWAIEHHKTNGPITLDDILPYYHAEWKSYMLHCPVGGTYTLGPVGENPRCSVAGHVLPK